MSSTIIIIIQDFLGDLLGGNALPPPGPPAVPTNLRLVDVTQQHLSQVNIEWAWDAVVDFGGGGATGVTYESEYRAVGGNWSAGGAYSRTALSRTIAVAESLTTQYEFRVRSVNNLGSSSAWVVSAPVTATAGAQPTGGLLAYSTGHLRYAGSSGGRLRYGG